jgi:hypothetical protein
MQTSTARAQLEYWKECHEALQEQLAECRRRYAEAREQGEGEPELQRIKERGEKLAGRVENGARTIADEEAQLDLQEDADANHGGCTGCAGEPEGGLCDACGDESDFNEHGSRC